MTNTAKTIGMKSILVAALAFVLMITTVMPAFAKKDAPAIVRSVSADVRQEISAETSDKLVTQIADRAMEAIR